MPITKRQFELGIDEEIQEWMREIYNLLKSDRELAYSSGELADTILGDTYDATDVVNLGRALDVLVEIGGVDKRLVADTDYYAFYRELDTDSWELNLNNI